MKRKLYFITLLSMLILFFGNSLFAQVPGTGISKDIKIKTGKYFISGDDATMFGLEYAFRFNMPLIAIDAGLEAAYGTVSVDKNLTTFAAGASSLEKIISIKGVGTLYLPKLLGGMGIFSPYVGLSYGYYINSMYMYDTEDNESVKGFGGSIKIGLDFSVLGIGVFGEFERVFNNLESTAEIPGIGSTDLIADADGNILWIGVRF